MDMLCLHERVAVERHRESGSISSISIRFEPLCTVETIVAGQMEPRLEKYRVRINLSRSLPAARFDFESNRAKRSRVKRRVLFGVSSLLVRFLTHRSLSVIVARFSPTFVSFLVPPVRSSPFYQSYYLSTLRHCPLSRRPFIRNGQSALSATIRKYRRKSREQQTVH